SPCSCNKSAPFVTKHVRTHCPPLLCIHLPHTAYTRLHIPPSFALPVTCSANLGRALWILPLTSGSFLLSPVCSVSGVIGGEKMVVPVQVSPLIKFARYSALLLGIVYGSSRYAYLKPIAEEDRRIEAEEKKKQEEAARIARELA
ncbi:unnamed protein product, partial [Staurois parvus]